MSENLERLLIWSGATVMLWLSGAVHIGVVLMSGVALPESLASTTLTVHAFGAAALPVLFLSWICVAEQKKWLFFSVALLFTGTVINAVTYGLSGGQHHGRGVNFSGGTADILATVSNLTGAIMLGTVFLVNIWHELKAWRGEVS